MAVFKTLCSGHCVRDTVFKTLCSGNCVQDTVFMTLCSGHCVQDSVFRTLCCVRDTVFKTPCSEHSLHGCRTCIMEQVLSCGSFHDLESVIDDIICYYGII